VDEELRDRLGAPAYQRAGFAADYDRYRPRPPATLLELLPTLGGVDRPRLVVDLGSGTGLSTRFWADAADEVVGVELNDAMREFAEEASDAPNVRYVGASAYETGLGDECADLVTAAQSLQWMKLDRAVPEIARILRPGGVFCAYNYFRAQQQNWEASDAFEHVQQRKYQLVRTDGYEQPRLPDAAAELDAAGAFRHVRELVLHSVEQCDGERLLGFALSEGSTRMLLEQGVSEEEIGLDRLRAVAAELCEPVSWWLGYQVWLCLRSGAEPAGACLQRERAHRGPPGPRAAPRRVAPSPPGRTGARARAIRAR
jgi:SAM-dependent methyltransferase